MARGAFIWMIITSIVFGTAMGLVMRFSNPKQDFYRKKDGTLDDLKFLMVGGIVMAGVFLVQIITFAMTRSAVMSGVRRGMQTA